MFVLFFFFFFRKNDPLNFLPDSGWNTVYTHTSKHTRGVEKKKGGTWGEVEGSCNSVANRLAVPVARYVYIAISSPAMNLRQFTVQGIYGRWLPTNYYAMC